ncbi:carnitine acetyl transferase [Coprinopsis cinerea okayama7|uniref:Carnitine acetyl transferase n=1 Tax=Coprinopsis cinerea (strain Okayama-7 / 130 / ATCC MYA-4618 / FGSC 9003) TaxID=240176 RepID=A8N9S9_COPC7|nr:carnitine acetyl transferase [Coprinopsis cinerea okayama7\|eukprot:XP_001831585.2 carnitine acetyl transferase [Coprinopsis cinerea okayama7\
MSTSTNLQFTRPADWKERAPEALPGSVTYAAQTKLPKLPVPNLQDTLSRLKETLKPIAWSEEELQAVLKKIDAFGAAQGPELHNRLLQRDAASKHWLESWWDDAGYMGYRDSVIINVSYYYGFDVPKPGQYKSPAERAAGIARSAMIFRQKLKQGLIPPEATKEGPLCMDTYRWMFDCCRVPGSDGLDFATSYAVPGDNGISGHIIVLRKNRVWKIEAVRDGKILSTADFARQLEYIYNNTQEEYPGVGTQSLIQSKYSALTVSFQDYKHLASSPVNASIIKEIHSSAFIICLDDTRPEGPIQHSRSLWHGDVVNGVPVGLRNRWADKPLNFIVYDNAYAGLLGEHSIMDGTPTARMCDNILDWLEDPAFDHGVSVTDSSVMPTPLDWEVTPTTKEAIAKADKAAKELIETQDMSYHLTPYGKDAIKKFGVSPDSWAQMIIQLAYKRLNGDEKRRGGTYEAATTRKFFKGRTEAIRVVSSESDAWVKSMDDPAVSAAQRKALFDAATKVHISRARAAGQGQGVDRHLFGLKKLLQPGEETPALFTDPVFSRSSYWVLSTSAIFSKHFPVYGWGEVVPDGFGVAYMTGYNDRLQYTVTSRKEMPNAQFIKEIARASEDIYKLHTDVAHIQKAKL